MAHGLKQNQGEECALERVRLGLSSRLRAAGFALCPTALSPPTPPSQAGRRQPGHPPSLASETGLGESRENARRPVCEGKSRAPGFFPARIWGCVSVLASNGGTSLAAATSWFLWETQAASPPAASGGLRALSGAKQEVGPLPCRARLPSP